MPSGSVALLSPSMPKTGRAIWNNFSRMSILFSLNHGAVTAVLNLAVVLLGAKGSFMNGALYVTYALTALLAAAAINARLGTRFGPQSVIERQDKAVGRVRGTIPPTRDQMQHRHGIGATRNGERDARKS